MKDFERIDKLSKPRRTLENALFAEIEFQFKEAAILFADKEEIRGMVKQEIAIAFQHLLERRLEMKITYYEGGQCLLSDCTHPPVEDSDYCREHIQTKDLK